MTHTANLHRRFRPSTSRLLAILATAAFLLLPATLTPGTLEPRQVGTNLGYSSGEWPFVDVFKTSSAWFVSGACGWNCAPDLDDDGWIRSLPDGDFASATASARSSVTALSRSTSRWKGTTS